MHIVYVVCGPGPFSNFSIFGSNQENFGHRRCRMSLGGGGVVGRDKHSEYLIH